MSSAPWPAAVDIREVAPRDGLQIEPPITTAAKIELLDALVATFPAGTLSGAPKPRAMSIIDDLEPARRGLYGGVVGYVDFAGDLDTAIAIRTALIRGDRAHVQAGAGVVADSDPASEDAECRAKAAAVLRAVAIAGSLRGIGES